MNARIFVVMGLSAAVWAGAHEYAPRENREGRDHGPARVWVEARPEHRDFERARFYPRQDRHEAWREDRGDDRREGWREDRRENWRREEWRRDRFEDRRFPAPVVVVEDCHRREPDRVEVSEPIPVRGTISINW